jgi:DNA-binding NarL/FixJ family response regulator
LSEDRIRIVVADDHALVREGVRHVLEDDVELEVVAEAGDGREALDAIIEHKPDVALLDITMPELTGIEVANRARTEAPTVKILILSMHDNAEYVRQAVRVGASGFLLKDEAGPGELRRAVRVVRDGGSYFSPSVAGHLAAAVRDDGGSDLESLTVRERQVLAGIVEGLANKQIALHLGISRRTVESHRESLMRKLEIRTVAGLTRFAIENGLLDLSLPPTPE